MKDFPMQYIDYRSVWWEKLSEKMHKLSSYVEQELAFTLHEGFFDKPYDADLSRVKKISTQLVEVTESVDARLKEVEDIFGTYDDFRLNWLHGKKGNVGVQEFLEEEVKPL